MALKPAVAAPILFATAHALFTSATGCGGQ